MMAQLQAGVREIVHGVMRDRGIEITPETYAEMLHNMLPKISTGEQALYVAVVAEITSIEGD